MDGVEIVMKVEDAFGVTITEAEPGAVTTPSELIDLVHSKVSRHFSNKCASMVAFHRIRKALVEFAGVPRRSIRLDTDIRWLDVNLSECALWDLLENTLPHPRWPRLYPPIWVGRLLGLFCVTIAVVLFTRRPQLDGILFGTASLFVGLRIWQLYRSRIPGRYATIGKLVRKLPAGEVSNWRHAAIAREVQTIVIGQLGLKEGEYREDAHFVRDLGLG